MIEASSGPDRISEIKAKISSDISSKERIVLLNELAFRLAGKSPEEAANHAREALELARKNGSQLGQAEALNTLGTISWYLADYEKTKEFHLEALEIWKRISNKQGIGRSFIGIGNAYLRLGPNNQALDYYLKALEVQQSVNDRKGIAHTYNNLGIVYKNQGDYDRALDSYLKSLKIKEELEDNSKGIANSIVNIGLLFYLQRELDKALEYLLRALHISTKNHDDYAIADVSISIGLIYGEKGMRDKALDYLNNALKWKIEFGDKMGTALSYQELGKVYERHKEYTKALESFRQALDLSQQIGSKKSIADMLTHIGNVYLELNEIPEAIDYLNKSLRIHEDVGSKDVLNVTYGLLSKCHARQNDFEKAYQYQLRHSDLKNHLFNEEKTKIISEMEVKYELDKKDLEIETLHLRQEILLEANKELELFASRAAHDLKEPLRMMSSYSDLLGKRCGEQLNEEGKEFLDIIRDGAYRMNHMLSSLLEFARGDTKSKELEDIHLSAVLELVKSNLQLAIKENSAEIEYPELPLIRATRVHMIQLFQNLISNSMKFCDKDKSEISIRFQDEGEFYLFYFTDNGIGIPIEHQDKVFDIFTRLHSRSQYEGSGIGLATCKKIIESLGGRIWIESTPGEGTTFSFTLPKAK